MYSKLLYTMARAANKQRVTYRLDPELAAALKHLPNQTAFVERTLREALSQGCPLCHGTGEAGAAHLIVSDLKRSPIGRLDRAAAGSAPWCGSDASCWPPSSRSKRRMAPRSSPSAWRAKTGPCLRDESRAVRPNSS